ncbi:MAG: type II secretion system GspH family protein [Patescibacteria group bacterium]|nr:type II secretion system GspH family protein [Patescibacteria group bacterium]
MKTGFTLLEILVVIALIGVLSAAGLASYLNTQRATRNSRRIADLKAIQGALESYFSTTGSYPNSPSCNPGSTYFPSGFPRDPQTGIQYAPSRCTSTEYCFCIEMEGSTQGNSTVNNCTNFASGRYFCVNQLQ